MKKVVISFGLFVVFGGVIVGTYYLVNQYLGHPRQQPLTVSCVKAGVKHVVTISGGKLDTPVVRGVLCDSLTITNEDDRLRLMAFGAHDHHTPYDGITEKVLSKGQSLTVRLNQLGTYSFHDHLEDSVVGYFVVGSR